MRSLTGSLRRVVALAASALSLPAVVPAGWSFAGNPHEYDCALDPGTTYNGKPSTYIKSKEGVKATALGSVVQEIKVTPYVGKRVRLSANLKSEDVEQWGGLWMRVDDANRPQKGFPSSVGFDDMHDRSVKGTTGWQKYSIVLDVPEGATDIYIGLALVGPGRLWMNGDKVEVVGTDVPVTGKPLAPPQPLEKGPKNLSFGK